MTPRVYNKALELLQVMHLDKYSLSNIAFCHNKTANAALKKLRDEKKIRIASWLNTGNHKIPVYALGYGKDAKRPRPMTKVESARKYRLDPEVCIAASMKKRAKRFMEKHACV